MDNPYLDEFLALPDSYRAPAGGGVGHAQEYQEEHREPEYLETRGRLVLKYSWAVPDDAAIAAVARHAREVVEVGAGRGYWASLLARAGVVVHAYDAKPPKEVWHPVLPGMAAESAARHPDAALLLCWPQKLSAMAVDALRAYRGRTAIYVGEFLRGSADVWFFWDLWHKWREVERVAIPRWFNRTDDLRIFERSEP